MNNSRQSFTCYRQDRYRRLQVLLLLFAPVLMMLTGCTSAFAAKTRTYYVAAVEKNWDYAPTGINQISGSAFGESENLFVQSGPERIGRIYRKALYREFTDATFTTEKARGPQWEHLGILGPVIRGEVGDTIQVVFKNLTTIPVDMHPHGVKYAKSSEGALYNDGTSGADRADDAIPPGGGHTYIWEVPKRSGPGPHDESSVLWMYHSHVDPPADMQSGLIGPIIIAKKGKARSDGSPKDIDREFVTLWTVFDENAGHYLTHNINTFTGNPGSIKLDDPGFQESNMMHSINGYVYGNLPGFTMNQGEKVRWYMLAVGNEIDLHTPHPHGQTFLWMGMRTDMMELLPGSMKTVDMEPDNPGTWLVHCHVDDHIPGGMMALMTVN